jgi:DNA-binding transcriptional LysR family regulator
VPPAHPWARPGRTVDAAELAATRLVAREPTSGTRTTAEAALAPHATPAPLLELSTSGAVLAAVAAGAGPAILSELAIRDNLAAHRVVPVTTRGVDFRRPLRAVWPHGQRPSRLARDLLAIARQPAAPEGNRRRPGKPASGEAGLQGNRRPGKPASGAPGGASGRLGGDRRSSGSAGDL